MKKVVALLCVLFVLVPTCFAEETTDYSYLDGMSFEELVNLRTEVDSRLAQEGFYEADAIPPGNYVVGTDIKAGTYMIKHLYAPDPSDSRASVYLFAGVDDLGNRGTAIDGFSMYLGDEHLIRLENGQYLKTHFMTLYLFDATSDEVKKSWQP